MNNYFSNLPIILWKESIYSATATVNTNWGNNDFHVWIDCSNETCIVGAINQFYTPLANGIYAVVVSNNLSCMDTSNCVTYSLVGIDELPEGVLAIYPNPSNGVFILSVTKDIIGQEIEITGTLGELVCRTSIVQSEQKIDLSKYASGTYFLSFIT